MNKKLMYSLSGTDVIDLCRGRVKLVTYDNIKRYKSIDSLLKPYGSVIILYIWEKNNNGMCGHYVCLNKLDDRNIELFDSFGFKPDVELEQIKDKSSEWKRYTGQEFKYLLQLLIDCNYNVHYNEYPMQNTKYNTCGRWAALRCVFKNLPLKTFVRMFIDERKEPDVIAVDMTKQI